MSPYLHSSYTLTRSSGLTRKVLFSSDSGASFRRWLSTWLRQTIEHHASGELQGEAVGSRDGFGAKVCDMHS